MKKMVINKNGKELHFNATIQFMDDEIREKLHREIAPCTKQKFFTAYEEAHKERFGEDWFLSEPNPTW